MKKFFLYIFLICSSLSFYAQIDSLVLNNGIKAIIKVVSLKGDDIKYTLPTENTGTVYTIKKNEVKKLYLNTPAAELTENKNNTAANTNNSVPSIGNVEAPYVFKRNNIGLNLGQMIFTTLSFSYQNISTSGSASLKVFGSYNFSPHAYDLQTTYTTQNYNNYSSNQFLPLNRKFTSGVEVNFFPDGQKNFCWYFGPAVQLGVLDLYYSDQPTLDSIRNTWPQYQYGYSATEIALARRTIKNGINSSFIINVGFMWHITQDFYAEANTGMGAQRILFNDRYDSIIFRGSFQMSVGYSF